MGFSVPFVTKTLPPQNSSRNDDGVTLPKCLPPQEAKDCREDLQITRFLLTSKTTARENGSIRLPKVQFGSNGLPKVKVATSPPAQPQPEFDASLPKAK